MLRRIAYLSRPCDNFPVTEIPRIFRVSRQRNADEGVSGVLVCTGNYFLEVIEGTQETIAELWERVLSDPRHVDAIVLADEVAEERWFADWRAGFACDAPTLARLAEWRERCAPLDGAEREELRRMLAACDAA
jgi:hypothetical protein